MKLENAKFSWTKWGRVTTGLETEDRPLIWACQICGEEQPPGIEAFLFTIGENQFLRICHKCQNIKIVKKIRSLHRFLRIIKILGIRNVEGS